MLTAVKSPAVPFDTARLDRLMDDAGMDVLLATSKHNVQYLLGGHRAFFFDYMDAFGISRYLPVVVYPKGAPDKAAFIGHNMESYQHQVHPFWTPDVLTRASGSVDAMQKAIEYVRKSGVRARRIGVEMAFVPGGCRAHAAQGNARERDHRRFVHARALSGLASRRRSCEMLKIASERVIESMLAVIANHGPGTTKQELADALKREEVNRGLTFEYCLIAAGSNLNRAPSEQKWEKGDVLSLDFRRQLSWLYRRPRSYGHPGRA